MKAIEQQLSVTDFFSLPDGDIPYELVSGKAIPKDEPMSLQRFHSSIQKQLLLLLNAWCQGKGDVYTELAVILRRNEEDWIPVPDLTYVSFARWPEQLTSDGPCPIVPELVIEIISPSQTFGKMTDKATAYLKNGILRVWVVDPAAKSLTVFYPDGPPQTFSGSVVMQEDLLPGLEVIPQQLFEQARIP
ncbi:MAG: Uma2 family endonuclease [Synechococcaceae cyanobacterium SM2_3_1]|nr:Uma2 family endonuclease [Synechococcaceae cyanobacterium SM2_3_1]